MQARPPMHEETHGMRARPPIVGARIGVANHRELVQPAPNHEGLAMHAPLHQVLHGFHEDVQPGQQTDRWVTKRKLATKIAIELRCACPAWAH